MNPSQKYNALINSLEQEIHKRSETRPVELLTKAAQSVGLSVRDLNAIFQFLTGFTLRAYVGSRQLNAAYQCLLRSVRPDVQEALSYTGYTDQSAFNRAFQKQFSMSPTEAWRQQDTGKVTSPLTWDKLFRDHPEPSIQTAKEEAAMETDTRFGISLSKMKLVEEALELESLYDFAQYQSDAAFRLAEKYHCPLKDAFMFVDDFSLQYGRAENGEASAVSTFLKRLEQKESLFPYCLAYNFSIHEVLELKREIAACGDSIEKLPPNTLRLYLHSQLDYPAFQKALRYYREHPHNVTLAAYIGDVQSGSTLEASLHDSHVKMDEMADEEEETLRAVSDDWESEDDGHADADSGDDWYMNDYWYPDVD